MFNLLRSVSDNKELCEKASIGIEQASDAFHMYLHYTMTMALEEADMPLVCPAAFLAYHRIIFQLHAILRAYTACNRHDAALAS